MANIYNFYLFLSNALFCCGINVVNESNAFYCCFDQCQCAQTRVDSKWIFILFFGESAYALRVLISEIFGA